MPGQCPSQAEREKIPPLQKPREIEINPNTLAAYAATKRLREPGANSPARLALYFVSASNRWDAAASRFEPTLQE